MKKSLPPKALARHRAEGQLNTKCHRVYKTGESLNLLLTRSKAIKVAANILRKANLLDDENLADEWTVKLWSIDGRSVKFGLEAIKRRIRKES
jgi:hypothetical protein